jgi:hypothetical protein
MDPDFSGWSLKEHRAVCNQNAGSIAVRRFSLHLENDPALRRKLKLLETNAQPSLVPLDGLCNV